jgi:hypothetical protein
MIGRYPLVDELTPVIADRFPASLVTHAQMTLNIICEAVKSLVPGLLVDLLPEGQQPRST